MAARRWSQQWRTLAALVALVALGFVALVGCRTSDAGGKAQPGDATPTPTAAHPAISVYPGDAAEGVRPDARVAVQAHNARLTAVSLRLSADAAEDQSQDVPGEFSDDRSSWMSTRGLRPGATYELLAEATGNEQGAQALSRSIRFTTASSAEDFRAQIRPMDGDTVGIAMPVVLTFSEKVAKEHRADIERSLKVETSVPVNGAWGWVSDREIHWRPQEFWPPKTEVTLRADLTGVPAADGLWGAKDREVTFRVTERPVRSVVDLAKHRLHVYIADELVKTIPITAGKPGFTTRSGTKVIIEKRAHMRMRSASIGIGDRSNPEYYDLEDVRYAMRVTWSGEFLHAAPWSAAFHGESNVSHGCTGMSTTNAKWLFDVSLVGDPVEFINSNRGLEPGNGYTDWNVDWADWQAQ